MQEQDSKVQKPSSRLKLGPVIGKGGFGEVRFAQWNGQPCAVKLFFLSQTEAAQNDIEREIRITRELRHPHIVQFHRAAAIHERLAFIMEYAEGGSLQRALRSSSRLDWPLKLKITQGIIRGLAYIHDLNIIHRDLKSGNVLLTSHMEAKLCDFGLATVKTLTTSMAVAESLRGSIRWMAPELFVKKPRYNTRTDMYGLGWIMWELASNSTPPFPEQPADAVIIDLVKKGERLPIPNDSDIPDEYRKKIQQCWHQDPSERPMARGMLIEETAMGFINCDDASALDLGPSSTSNILATPSEIQANEAAVASASGSSTQLSTTLPSGSTNPSLLTAVFQDIDLKEIDDYHDSAKKDDKDALFAMGEMHLTGTGAIQSDFEALVCFQRAAEKGHAEAQFRIGQMYEAGRLIPRDVVRARHWFEQAKEQGHAQAEESLRVMSTLREQATSLSRMPTLSTPQAPQTAPDDYLPPFSASGSASPMAQTRAGDIVIGRIIGQGGFGTVYHGRWGTCQVAIKRPYLLDSQHLQQEVQILQELKYRHIIQFYDMAYHDGQPVIIMDLAEGGDLGQLITKGGLDWQMKARIAQEIARGIAYLHGRGIIHRNLKSRTVLLTRHLEVKLGGFGISLVKNISGGGSNGGTKGTLLWMAPELFEAKPLYSTKSDMYALGMVMWAMAANCAIPFGDHDIHEVLKIVHSGGREEIPEDTPQNYRQWTEKCWHQDPSERPEASWMIVEDDYESWIDDRSSVTTFSFTDEEVELSADES